MSREELLIWAAGFIDGEGCISMWGKKSKTNEYTYYNIQLQVFQTTHEPLQILKRLFGGTIRQGKNECGWRWQATCGTLKAALEELLPYLVVKKKQAEIAISVQARKRPRGEGAYGRDAEFHRKNAEDCEMMHHLKRVVWQKELQL